MNSKLFLTIGNNSVVDSEVVRDHDSSKKGVFVTPVGYGSSKGGTRNTLSLILRNPGDIWNYGSIKLSVGYSTVVPRYQPEKRIWKPVLGFGVRLPLWDFLEKKGFFEAEKMETFSFEGPFKHSPVISFFFALPGDYSIVASLMTKDTPEKMVETVSMRVRFSPGVDRGSVFQMKGPFGTALSQGILEILEPGENCSLFLLLKGREERLACELSDTGRLAHFFRLPELNVDTEFVLELEVYREGVDSLFLPVTNSLWKILGEKESFKRPHPSVKRSGLGAQLSSPRSTPPHSPMQVTPPLTPGADVLVSSQGCKKPRVQSSPPQATGDPPLEILTPRFEVPRFALPPSRGFEERLLVKSAPPLMETRQPGYFSAPPSRGFESSPECYQPYLSFVSDLTDTPLLFQGFEPYPPGSYSFGSYNFPPSSLRDEGML